MKDKEKESFINRKRPAVKGLVEDVIGPVTQLDQNVYGKPDPKAEAEDIKNDKEIEE